MKSKQKQTNKNSLLLGVKFAVIIQEFLSSREKEEFTPMMISKELEMPYNIVTATLYRLVKAGRIWKPDHGLYSAKCTLNPHQIKKAENAKNLSFHHLDIVFPKIYLSELLKEKQPIHPTGSQKQPDLNTQKQTDEIIEIGVNQTISIVDNPENYMVVVSCGENPLSVREGLWLCAWLKLRFGEEAYNNARLVNRDINHDIREKYSPNEMTLGEFQGALIAVYGKGDITRMELRNNNPNIPLTQWLETLLAYTELERSIQLAAEPKTTKSYLTQSKATTESQDFKTASQMLKEQQGWDLFPRIPGYN